MLRLYGNRWVRLPISGAQGREAMTWRVSRPLASAGVRPSPVTRKGTPHIIANVTGAKHDT
ncbi:hypothetical protein GCM10025883_26530 [Mobilicoccus caccae]|uniref:Uncharacterized protein n=1 Tax=Mobilicoccus caccae TaxID=1859295 RepID=A0ABQ6IVA1_9MICO|nr:hypothetical protein GCM10025883_26530 [Mobilicoccus caccae]